MNNKDAVVEVKSKSITQKEIQNIEYQDFGLSKDSKEALNNWQKYQELSNQIDYLKTADLSFFKSEKTELQTFLNDFKTEIPRTIATNEISARILVLETKVLKLNSLLTLDNIKKSDQLKGINEVLIAMSNLNLQINKKFEFDANNISKSTIDQ
ncbi:hypothetical protein [uncultured Psychroserpens sp.]|uniref:hypothetical protein n=1 Tax=uncultured Psychroserpens sp. TaxID=255436 RepID=UPI0026311AD7|nr:hypothetical protein [uncultured Psychroserpens sp.]